MTFDLSSPQFATKCMQELNIEDATFFPEMQFSPFSKDILSILALALNFNEKEANNFSILKKYYKEYLSS